MKDNLTRRPARPQALLFDLGGVIVPWVGIKTISALTGISAENVTQKFSKSDILKSYEVGACSDTEFLAEMLRVFKFKMSVAELNTAWNSWVKPPFPNTLKTLARLRQSYPLACLSNTNAMHWDHISYLFDSFDFCMASHLLKCAKPDPKIYRIARKVLGVSYESIWFFDDTIANVKAAQACGMTAFHIDKSIGVIPTLRALKLV